MKKQPKKKTSNKTLPPLLAILICLCLVAGFNLVYHSLKASPSAQVQFTADTKIDLSGIGDTSLYALKNSECDSLTVGDPDLKTLKVDIPSSSSFALGTADHNVLKLTPSGGTVTLIFNSDYFSSGYVSQWNGGNTLGAYQVNSGGFNDLSVIQTGSDTAWVCQIAGGGNNIAVVTQ